MDSLIEIFSQFVHIVLHLDQYLAQWTSQLGSLTYLLLFTIIFCETGLVFLPFLPGDSLLFAAGAITSLENSGIQIYILSFILMIASFVGDNLNYYVGRKFGIQIFYQTRFSILKKIFNQESLKKTQDFFERYGKRSVFLGRFIPIIRTFTPFVAGTAGMKYSDFVKLSAIGSICWINIFLWAGHVFGNLDVVKRNFHIVIIGVILISVIPIFFEYLRKPKKIVNS